MFFKFLTVRLEFIPEYDLHYITVLKHFKGFISLFDFFCRTRISLTSNCHHMTFDRFGYEIDHDRSLQYESHFYNFSQSQCLLFALLGIYATMFYFYFLWRAVKQNDAKFKEMWYDMSDYINKGISKLEDSN